MPNRFRVALSYPGEHRDFVLQVAEALADELTRDGIFYDEWYEVELLGTGGDLKLQSMYKQADLIVPFFSRYYSKPWCSMEWGTIRGILLERRREDSVIPVHLDESEIPGWSSLDFGIHRHNRTAQQIADLILRLLMHRQVSSMKKNIEEQQLVLDKQQDIINRLVIYSMAFFYFRRLEGIHDALANGTDYVFHHGDAKDFEYLRDHGYIELQGIRQLRDGQDISRWVKLTPIGEYYVGLRREYERKG